MSINIDTQHIFCRDFNKVISEYRTAIMSIVMLVMLFHQYFTSFFPFNVFHNFESWGVVVFLFLSGMGLARSQEQNPIPIFYKRKFKRIIPSCILCGTSKYIVFLLLGSSVAVLKDGLKLGWWSLASFDSWFVPAILILYVISPHQYHVLQRWLLITTTFIIIVMFTNGQTIRPVIGYEWTSPIGILSWTIERLPVFTVGMLVTIKDGRIDYKILYSAIFLLIAFAIKLFVKFSLSLYGYQAYAYLFLSFGIPALIVINVCIINILVHGFIFWSLKINYPHANPMIMLTISFLISSLAAHLCKCVINKFIP